MFIISWNSINIIIKITCTIIIFIHIFIIFSFSTLWPLIKFSYFCFLTSTSMQVPDIIIAIDGFSATGKSTLAKLIAETFSFLYLDSGALYRGVTLFAQENGYIDPDNTVEIKIKDWGRGIDDVAKAREPMYTTGGDERSGMGFTIMESFTDTLKVVSKPGKGTLVTMRRKIAVKE